MRSAAGRMAVPVVIGRAEMFGKPGSAKLRKILSTKMPGDNSVLGDHCIVEVNHTGWMNTRLYASTVFSRSVMAKDTRSVLCHDNSCHGGELIKDGEVVEQFLTNASGQACGTEEYVAQCLNGVVYRWPPCYMRFRPNDRAWTNLLFRHRYDVTIKELVGDSRPPQPEDVLMAVILANVWLDTRPETVIAT